MLSEIDGKLAETSPRSILPAIKVNGTPVSTIPSALKICGIELPILDSLKESLSGLRSLTTIADTVHTIAPGESYTIITNYKDVWLGQADPITGQLPAVPRSPDGKILEHPQWKKVGVDAIKTVKVVASQALLVHISMQVNQIISMVDSVTDRLHDDRVAELEGCVRSLATALNFENPEHINDELCRVTIPLQQAISKNIRALKAEIDDCPSAKTSIFDAWGGDGLQAARKKMARAQDTAHNFFQGVVALYYAYACRTPSEITVAEETAIKIFSQLFSIIDFSLAHQCMALVAGGGNSTFFPSFWSDLYTQAESFCSMVQGQSEIELIISPCEHLGQGNE